MTGPNNVLLVLNRRTVAHREDWFRVSCLPFFDLLFLITLLVSSNLSCKTKLTMKYTEHYHIFAHFLVAIVLSVLLRCTDSNYSFGIFKLFLISFFYLIFNNTYYYNIIFCNLYLIYLNNKDTTDTQKYVSYFNLQLEVDN